MKTKVKTIKSVLAIIIFSSALIFNISFAHASYSAGTLVSMTNSARAQNGLGELSTNSALASAAYAKANDILSKDYFAHNSPDGRTPWDFINEAGYNYAYAGENLAIGYTDASELFSAWMASTTHRDNILNPNFREIGIAVVSGEFQGAETMVAVQEFGAAGEANSSQVASETATPEPINSEPANTESNPQPAQTKTFELIKDKSEFSPTNIFAGEEITFKVTLRGEIKTLEAQAFGKNFNLLETGSVTGSDEKTYILKQKIDNEGLSEVKIVATDKNGNSETLNLGNLEAKKTVLIKEQTQNNSSGLIGGLKESLRNNWVVYTILFSLIVLIIAIYFIHKKTNFNRLITSWRF